jgi:hypothetical protein
LRRQLVIAIAVFAAALGAAAPAAASAQAGSWATVNVCGGNEVGVRASLPGDGSDSVMSARVSVQWLDPRSNAWEPVDGVPRSPWLAAGSGTQDSAQVGWTFDFEQPPPGAAFQIRGVAELQWVRNGTVVRRDSRVTSGGLAGVAIGSSLGACTLR